MLPFHLYLCNEAYESEDIFIEIAFFYLSLWFFKLYVFRKAGLSEKQKYTSITMGLVLIFMLIFLTCIFLLNKLISYNIQNASNKTHKQNRT